MTSETTEMNYQYFLKANIENYIGEWIAICGNKIVAHGRNLKEVTEQAKKLSEGRKFLLARVPSKEAMIF